MWDDALLGRRDAGADLQPEHRQGHRDQRARRGADRRDARVLPRAGADVSARVRAARRGDAGHAGRDHDDAGRVRHAEPGGRARARDRAGRRLPDRGADRGQHRARTRSDSSEVARLASASFLAARRRASAKRPEPGEIFRQPDLAATLRKLVEAERRRSRRARIARQAI